MVTNDSWIHQRLKERKKPTQMHANDLRNIVPSYLKTLRHLNKRIRASDEIDSNAVKALAELVYPEPQSVVPAVKVPAPPGEIAQADERQLEEQQQTQRRWALRRAVLNLVGSVAMLALAGPVYIYHWRKVRSESSGVAPDAMG